MQNLRPSETALKVAYGLLSLSAKPGWRDRLPAELAPLTETLILEAKVFGYNRSVVGLSRRRWMVGLYDRFEKILPGVFEGIGERKLFMDWAVERTIGEGAKQVLIVGAGFDTLCLRLARKYPEVSFFEVDHPATAVAKARGVAKIGKPDNLTLLQADLGLKPLSEVLAEEQAWDAEVKTVAVAEGLLYYLRTSDVASLFDYLAESTGSGSQVAFSYLENHRKHGWATIALNALREPWLSSCSEAKLSEYVGEGWRVSDLPNPTSLSSNLEKFAIVDRSN